MTQWEYARLEYQETGSYGTDKHLDWSAVFHTGRGTQRWGVDDRFDDLKHLDRAGALGWQVYARSERLAGQPQRAYQITFAFKRPASQAAGDE